MDQMEIMQLKEMIKGMSKNQRIALYEQKKKSEGIALLLSFIIPGAGSLYVGKILKGILVLLFSWTIVVYIYGLYAAYKDAKDRNAILYSIFF